MPISLSYQAGGIKVQEPASWVGAGWSLQAGGVITRTVMGAPDERSTSNAKYGYFSDYGYANYWTTGGGVDQGTGQALSYDYGFANSLYDGEPDLFFFNFNGYTGKFYFSDDRTPILVDGGDLKIEYYYPVEQSSSYTNRSANIQGFIITAPTGDKYYFGITDNTGIGPVEMTIPISEGNTNITENVFSSYYLSKIVAADGIHTINFTYQSEKYSYYTLLTFPLQSDLAPDPNNPSAYDSREYRLGKNYIDGVRLSQITFSNGTISFNAGAIRTDLSRYIYSGLDESLNTESTSLDNIKISGTGICKQFAFSYSYFQDNTSLLAPGIKTPNGTSIDTDKRRLKLESVQEKSCDGTLSNNPWVFAYYSNFLPRRLSFAQDHWGFYNGKEINNTYNTLIPTYSTNSNHTITTYAGADRDAAWPAMENGMLTQITYPTGGSAVFEYEPNDVWVNYKKYQYQPVATACAGAYCSSLSQTLSIPFSGNPYRFRLTYQGNSSSSYPGKGAFAGPYVSLAVYKASNKLVDEVIVQPTPGVRSYSLTADTPYSGSVESVYIQVDEYVSQDVQQNVLAGGIRIKTITAKESATATGMVTAYAYQANGRSTGTLYSRPRYVQVIRNSIVATYGFPGNTSTYNPNVHGCMGPEIGNGQLYLKSPCGIVPMSTTQGNHLGYDQVTVTKSGNGRAEYYYYGADYWKSYNDVCYRVIDPTLCDPALPSLPAVPLPFDFSRGQLKYERIFDQAGHLLKDSQYTYRYDSSKVTTPCYLVRYVGSAMLGAFYNRKAYWENQSQVIETTLSATGESIQVTKIDKYDSPYHRQLTQQTEIRSAGEVIDTKNKYIFDFRIAACDNIADGTGSYNTACSSCDATYYSQLGTCTTYDCKRRLYRDNLLCRANARKDYITYRRNNFTNSTNNFQAAHTNAKYNADGSLLPLLQLQDNYTNTLVESSQWKNDHLLGASYTAFSPGLTQPATMYPARLFSLFLTSPATVFAPATVSGNSVSLDSRYAATPEVTLTFDNGNLVEITPKTGIVTSYVWGYTNTLPVAKAIGVRYATLNAAYNNAGGNLTTLRGQSSLAKALLSTYSHQPLVGVTSQTDPSGRSLTYEYDALGRLVRTRNEQGRILTQLEYHYGL